MASITTVQPTDLITDSRANLNDNFANLNADKIETSVLDTDTTLAANSDAKVATQKAVKAYVDAGGNVNATETTKGIVEIATDSEVAAGTATGATGASLVVTPDKLITYNASLAAPIVNTYLVGASPATWTKDAGLKYVIVEVIGGGGGGEGDSATGGGSGGEAGYSREMIVAASLGATETVTIGAAGVGSGATGTGETAGGTSSFGSHCQSTGGSGGGTSGGAGGVGSGGDINGTGKSGDFSDAENGGTFGRFGSGGQGAGTSNPGLAGGAGIVIVTEYYV